MSAYFLIERQVVGRAAEAPAEVLPRLAYLVIDRVDQTVRGLNGFVASAARSAVEWFARWREQQVALRELSRLNDRMLKDIGISRGEIRAVVYGWARTTEPESAATAIANPGVVQAHGEKEVTWRKAA